MSRGFIQAFASKNNSWLWSALFSILVCITDMFGYVVVEMISSSISYHQPSLGRLKPLVSLLVKATLIMLCLTAQGGAHMFKTLKSYIADWSLLLINIVVNNVEVCL